MGIIETSMGKDKNIFKVKNTGLYCLLNRNDSRHESTIS